MKFKYVIIVNGHTAGAVLDDCVEQNDGLTVESVALLNGKQQTRKWKGRNVLDEKQTEELVKFIKKYPHWSDAKIADSFRLSTSSGNVWRLRHNKHTFQEQGKVSKVTL